MLAAFAATGYHQKITQFKIKISKKWCYSDDIALGFFLCNISVEQHCTGFLPVQCNVVPGVLQHY